MVLDLKITDSRRRLFSRYPLMYIGGGLLLIMVFLAVFAPLLFTSDPIQMNPVERLKTPSLIHWFGTDMFGRDIYSRTVYGSRISMVVGLVAAVLSVILGLFIAPDRETRAIARRIPGILLAIALVSLSGASLITVTIAITIPEIPRVVRLVRSIVLSVREEPYVEAAIAAEVPVYPLFFQDMFCLTPSHPSLFRQPMFVLPPC